jgi:hypothetical protein
MCVGGAHKDLGRCAPHSPSQNSSPGQGEKERGSGAFGLARSAHYACVEGLTTRGGRRTRESSAALGNFYNCSLCGGGGGVCRKY